MMWGVDPTLLIGLFVWGCVTPLAAWMLGYFMGRGGRGAR